MMWIEFALALGAFLLSHAIPMRPALRARLIGLMGRWAYFMAYSLLSLGLLAWLISAAARAPYLGLWPPLHGAPLWGMPVVCWLIAEGLMAPNPLSLGRRGAGPHPLAPLTRHPLPLALALWAGLHILANPDLAHTILFGLLGGFSLLSMRLLDRRKQRQMGPDWPPHAAGSALFNPAALPRIRPSLRALALAALLYGALALGHPYFAGVPALPI